MWGCNCRDRTKRRLEAPVSLSESTSPDGDNAPLLRPPRIELVDPTETTHITMRKKLNITVPQRKPKAKSCVGCGMFPSCMSILSRRPEPKPRPGQVAVMLNVYDMYWTNWYTAGAGVGVFHSGVQVHGAEWAYGGHPYAFTGIFEIAPRDDKELGDQFRFRQSVNIGYTDFDEAEVRHLVMQLGKQFRGDRYHLMKNNCNHFTSAFCMALCETDIPSWVNRLAYVSSCVPFLQRCLPKEWLTPAALQHSLVVHSRPSSPATSSAQTPSSP